MNSDRTEPESFKTLSNLVRKAVAPSAAVMGRLNITRKFGVVMCAMLVPLLFVTFQYRSAQEHHITIARSERAGLTNMKPNEELLIAVIDARQFALSDGDTAASASKIASLIGQVESTVKQHGSLFANAETWSAAKAAIDSALGAKGTSEATLEVWNAAADAVYTDIQQVSAGSTLVLDPQLDTYNVMDATTNRVLLASDLNARALSLGFLIERNKVADPETARIDVAKLGGNGAAALATFDAEMKGAYASTDDKGLQPRTDAARAAVVNGVGEAVAVVDRIVTGETANLDLAKLTGGVTIPTSKFLVEALPALDNLFATRIDGIESHVQTVYLAGFFGLIAVLYLVAGAGTSAATTSRKMVFALDQAQELLHVAGSMAEGADTTVREASNLSSASEQISANANSVAAALEEMQASISEITRGAFDAASTATDAVEMVRSTRDTIAVLASASKEIGSVVEVISSIAEDTNMLALNATIEAARAGDSGKGFAVVASEVKELANETAKATHSIKETIARIQRETETAIGAIDQVVTVIDTIHQSQDMIAAAVEEQGATTSEMVRSITEVAFGINEISSSVRSMVDIAENTARDASDTLASAAGLSELTHALK